MSISKFRCKLRVNPKGTHFSIERMRSVGPCLIRDAIHLKGLTRLTALFLGGLCSALSLQESSRLLGIKKLDKGELTLIAFSLSMKAVNG